MDLVRDCDIIALQEVDCNWDRSGNRDQVEQIANLMPDHDIAFGPTIDVAKHSGSGFQSRARRRSGNMILSKYPIIATRNFLLPRYGAVGKLDMQKGVLEASMDSDVGPLRVYATHLCHLCDEQRMVQAKQILDIHEQACREGPVLSGEHHTDSSFASEIELPPVPGSAILLGDFNFLPDSDVYSAIAGALSPRWGRVVRRGGFVDAWVVAGNEDGFGEDVAYGATAADRKRRIDYCFVSSDLAPLVTAAEVYSETNASDHFPVVMTLQHR